MKDGAGIILLVRLLTRKESAMTKEHEFQGNYRRVDDDVEYQGYFIRVFEKWGSGALVGGQSSLGYRVEWKRPEMKPLSAELFPDVESAVRHAKQRVDQATRS